MKRIYNIFRYGLGENARARKRAHKSEKRKDVFESGLWRQDGQIAQRDYASYDEYVKHQASKLDRVIGRLRENEADHFADFKNRFENCEQLRGARTVLCLGARLGTEVRALHALGYFAVGIDLNPGPENCYVLTGDFHGLVFADNSVDAVYTNTLDHVFDLDKMIGEIRRVLRPDGIFIADILQGFEDEEGFVPGAYESTHWRDSESFLDKIRDIGEFSREGGRDLEQTGRDRWRQAVFRKPA